MRLSRIVLIATGTALVGALIWILLVPTESGVVIATVLGSLVGIGALGVTVWSVLRPSHPASSAPTSGAGSPGSERVDDVVKVLTELARAMVSAQLDELTNRGRMTPPWTVAAGTATGPLRRRRRHADKHGIPALAEVLVNNAGRMEIIGRSDSGKTTSLYLLADFLLTEPTAPALVPFPVSLASWKPMTLSLFDWMARQLMRNHPQLSLEHTHADLMTALGSGRIVPFLDGFDEIVPSCQEDAREALRIASGKVPMVLTSRPLDPRDRRLLAGGARVELEPLDVSEITRYLTVNSDGDQPWRETVRTIEQNSRPGLTATLTSPLMAWLACTVYAPRLGERRDLDELGGDTLAEQSVIEDHLLRTLVPEVFKRRSLSPNGQPTRSGHYRQAEAWLGFLAANVGRNRLISFWTLSRIAPMYRIGFGAAVTAGIGLGLVLSLLPELAAGLVIAQLLGLFFGLAFIRAYAWSRSRHPRDPNRTGYGGRVPGMDGDWYLHAGKFAFGVCLTVVMCGAITAIDRAGAAQFVQPRLLLTVAAATVLVTAAAGVGGIVAAAILRARPGLESGTGAQAQTPVEVVANDRRSGLGMIVLAWVFHGTVVAAVLQVGTGQGLLDGIIAGVGAVPAATSVFNVWVNYKVAHLWLVFRNRLPWRLVDFLHEAHQKGILRQNGISYEFRHDRLRTALVGSAR